MFDDINNEPAVLTGLPFHERDGRYGAYVSFQQQITRPDADDSSRGLTLFLNAAFTDRRTAVIDSQIALGLIYDGPFDLRPKDEIGLAAGWTMSMIAWPMDRGCRT